MKGLISIFVRIVAVALIAIVGVVPAYTPVLADDSDVGSNSVVDAAAVYPDAEITRDASGNPTFLSGSLPLPVQSVTGAQVDAISASRSFVDAYGHVFGVADASSELVAVESEQDDLGLDHVTYQQVHAGIDVFQGQLSIHIDLGKQVVVAAGNAFIPGVSIPSVDPVIQKANALELARELMPSGEPASEPELIVFAGVASERSAENAALAWKVDLISSNSYEHRIFILDANTGVLLDVLDRTYTSALAQEDGDQIVSPAIMGGIDATPGEYPWMAAINVRTGLVWRFNCGGTLINSRYVLTAAHCVFDENGIEFSPSNVGILLGTYHRDRNLGEWIAAGDVIPHPKYLADEGYDIALIRLQHPSAQPPMQHRNKPTDDSSLTDIGNHATVVGWGNTEVGRLRFPTEDLQQLTQVIVDNDKCDMDPSNGSAAYDGMICAGYQETARSPLWGDSGGPLLTMNTDNQWVQIGIANTISPTADYRLNHGYTSYARVAFPEHRDWIEKQLTGICDSVSQIPNSECKALALFYHGTDGTRWTSDTGWMQNNEPCSWQGVTCSSGHVTSIDLHSNGLAGSIPSEIGDLSYLQSLVLHTNQIQGLAPSELGDIAGLRTLNLSHNRIYGEIPASLGNLASLRTLDLGWNSLTGGLPPTLGQLSRLESLNVSHNQLSLPLPVQIGELSSIKSIDISNCSIPGYIPSIMGSLSGLTSLNLSGNQLIGPIPSEFGKLTNLNTLNLQHNRLCGHIPLELSKASKLDSLLLNDNQLSGPLVQDLTKLSLSKFLFNDNSICEPQDDDYQQWLDSIDSLGRTNIPCPQASEATRYATYSALNVETLPGELVRVDDEPAVDDKDTDNAHDFTSATYWYYLNTHNRLSYDDYGGLLISTVHYGQNYNNAFWNGEQMVYGDGYPVKDVAAHEITHGVTQETAGLEYRWQSGALSESMSDIFGVMVDRDDWLIGEDLPSDALGGRDAIRSLADPEAYGQPAHVDDWVRTCSDNEGVHVNSSLVSKAFYNTAAAIGKGPAERIFYRALVYYLQSNSSLEDARAAALQAAKDLYGDGQEYKSVAAGFADVGLDGNWNPSSNDCTCAASSALVGEGSAATNSVIGALYGVRDGVLSTTPTGQHYKDLYYKHSDRISLILVMNPGLAVEGVGLLHSFAPELASLATGQPNDQMISGEQVDAVLAYLAKLEADAITNGDSELATDIAIERSRIDWEALPGMTIDEAWYELNSIEMDSSLFLPIVVN